MQFNIQGTGFTGHLPAAAPAPLRIVLGAAPAPPTAALDNPAAGSSAMSAAAVQPHAALPVQPEAAAAQMALTEQADTNGTASQVLAATAATALTVLEAKYAEYLQSQSVEEAVHGGAAGPLWASASYAAAMSWAAPAVEAAVAAAGPAAKAAVSPAVAGPAVEAAMVPAIAAPAVEAASAPAVAGPAVLASATAQAADTSGAQGGDRLAEPNFVCPQSKPPIDDSVQRTQQGQPELLHSIIVLRHPAIAEQLGIISRLLATSRSVAEAVHSHVAGSLDLQHAFSPWPLYPADQAAKLTWLDRNAGLMRNVNLRGLYCHEECEFEQLAATLDKHPNIMQGFDVCLDWHDDHGLTSFCVAVTMLAAHGAKVGSLGITFPRRLQQSHLEQLEGQLAAALQQAAAGSAAATAATVVSATQTHRSLLQAPTGPYSVNPMQTSLRGLHHQLSSLRSLNLCGAVGTSLLPHLPASLSELSIQGIPCHPLDNWLEFSMELTRLTGLQKLVFYFDPQSESTQQPVFGCLPALACLSSLTLISLDHMQSRDFVTAVNFLPLSLCKLEVNLHDIDEWNPDVGQLLGLGHLTRLTRLFFEHMSSNLFPAGSLLPASLVELIIVDIEEPWLVNLPCLRKLEITDCTISHSEFNAMVLASTSLEVIEVRRPSGEYDDLDAPLLLGHLTRLSTLVIDTGTSAMPEGSVLPASLVELKVDWQY